MGDCFKNESFFKVNLFILFFFYDVYEGIDKLFSDRVGFLVFRYYLFSFIIYFRIYMRCLS